MRLDGPIGAAGLVRVFLLALLPAGPVTAQSLSIRSIASPSPALGTVVSANSGATLFRVAANSGMVTRISGTGVRVSGSSTRPLVTLACGSDSLCDTSDVAVTVTSIGAPTGRAGALANFTIDPLTAQVTTEPTGTDPVRFVIAPIGTNGTRTFYIGADFPILGDDSAMATGPASAAFQVTVQFSAGGSADTAVGQAIATVLRPIAVATTTGLAFGTIVPPTSGTAAVTIDAATGARSVVGTGARGIGTGAHQAGYSVSGEGGQAFSVLVPSEMVMTGSGDSITVALTTTAAGAQSLSGSLGQGGTASFGVGGSFALGSDKALGAYSGSFVVTVQYQ